jgi:hypothetical protein
MQAPPPFVLDPKLCVIDDFFAQFSRRGHNLAATIRVWRARALPPSRKFPASPLEELPPIFSTGFCSGAQRSTTSSPASMHIRACRPWRIATAPWPAG